MSAASPSSVSKATSGQNSSLNTSCASIQDVIPVKGSKHTNQQWLDQLRRDFFDLIIGSCSAETRESYENDADIQDMRSKKRVRTEIMHSVIEYMVMVYGPDEVPKLAVMRDVATVMGNKYPNMFQIKGSDDTKFGYGLGGMYGNKSLPGHLVEKFKARVSKKGSTPNVVTMAANDGINTVQIPKKKHKQKEVYGVDQKKFYTEKANIGEVEEIAQSGSITDKVKREAVYEKHREALQREFRFTLKVSI